MPMRQPRADALAMDLLLKLNIDAGGVQAHRVIERLHAAEVATFIGVALLRRVHRVIERLHAAEQAGMAGGAGHAAAQSQIVLLRDLA